MGKASPPAPVDPVATSQAQSQANANTAAAQAALNYTNQYTPYGSTTYNRTGSYTTPEGQEIPTYSQYTSLSPLGQTILTGEQNVASNIMPWATKLSDYAGAVAATPLNFNTPYSATLNAGPQMLDQRAVDALYGTRTKFLDPQFQQQQTQLEDQLSRQGIPVGSEAYNNAMDEFNRAKTQAYGAAADQAIAGGTSAASNLFNMALAGQQQNIAQQQTGQSYPIQLLQMLMGAAPSTQSQPIVQPGQINVAPTDVTGAYGLNQQGQQAAYQGQVASQNATMGGLASVAAAAAIAI